MPMTQMLCALVWVLNACLLAELRQRARRNAGSDRFRE